MKNFEHMFKWNEVLVQCDGHTLKEFLSATNPFGVSETSSLNGLTPWQEAKKDKAVADKIQDFVLKYCRNNRDCSVEEVKRSVATNHQVKISYNAVLKLQDA